MWGPPWFVYLKTHTCLGPWCWCSWRFDDLITVQEEELDLEEQAKHSEAEALLSKAEVAAHLETLRDTAPVIEGIKVTLTKHSLKFPHKSFCFLEKDISYAQNICWTASVCIHFHFLVFLFMRLSFVTYHLFYRSNLHLLCHSLWAVEDNPAGQV